jgi:hypothetical protein
MFPNPYYTPAPSAQFLVDPLVTCFVGRKFFAPKRPVSRWPIAVLRAAVPETAVNKNSNLLPTKNKIWLTENFLFSPPASDMMLP